MGLFSRRPAQPSPAPQAGSKPQRAQRPVNAMELAETIDDLEEQRNTAWRRGRTEAALELDRQATALRKQLDPNWP